MRFAVRLFACLMSPLVMTAFAQDGPTYEDILRGFDDPERWLTYSGDYSGRRHSPLTQITPENVSRLRPIWTFQTGTTTRGRGFEATPLVDDGVLYVTGSINYAWAIDARSGRAFWTYRRNLPDDLTYGASAPVNRGFGMLGNRLFMATLDAHLLAMDRRPGDNLYSNSIVALDADRGDLRWHYQFTPHDINDWDSNHVPVLVDAEWRGEPRKLVMMANRNGFFYVLDRTDGELLLGEPFTGTTWAREIGPDGRPVILKRRQPGLSARPLGFDQFHAAFLQPRTGVVLRHGAGNLRHLCA